MKTKNIRTTFLNVLLTSAFAMMAPSEPARAQNAIPELHTSRPQISIQDGQKKRRDGWSVSADADPDIYESQVPPGTSKTVKFISREGELSFQVEGGKAYPFNVIYAGKTYHTQIVGKVGRDTYDLKF